MSISVEDCQKPSFTAPPLLLLFTFLFLFLFFSYIPFLSSSPSYSSFSSSARRNPDTQGANIRILQKRTDPPPLLAPPPWSLDVGHCTLVAVGAHPHLMLASVVAAVACNKERCTPWATLFPHPGLLHFKFNLWGKQRFIT